MISAIIIAVTFGTYSALVWSKFGVQSSVSASFFSWKDDNSKPWSDRLLFILMTSIIGFSFVATMPTLFGWIAASGMMITGVAGDYRNKLIGPVHTWASTISILAAVFSFGFKTGQWVDFITPVLFLLISGFMYLIKLKNKTWWIEHMAIVIVLFQLFKYHLSL